MHTQGADVNAKDKDELTPLIEASMAGHTAVVRELLKQGANVDAQVVNAAMIREINTVPQLTLPIDGGVGAGKKIGAVDYLIQTGDIANRMEASYQSASASWSQFETDYIQNVTLTDHNHKKTTLLLVPGNHDISNAIGFSKPMEPKTDPTAMVKIYNLMLKPVNAKTNANYNY